MVKSSINIISVDPQNNISVGIPSDLQSERQEQPAEESKMANDIGQFFDNTVNKYFPNTPLNNDSIDDNESDSIDDNESNEIFDQTSQSAKPMLDSPGDVGNKFINSHLPKDLVLDGKVEDVINNQVLKMSNDINPTGNKSSVIPSKRLNQNEDQSQKSQIREKVLQGKSGHAKEKIPVLDKQVLPSHLSTVVNPTENKTSLSPLQDQKKEQDQVKQLEKEENLKQKEKPVLNNQVASHNKTFSNVSKSQSQNKDQIQKLVVKQKKERGLEQEKESDLEKEEKKLEQREKEQEKLEELLHQREEILEKQEVLKKQQELKEKEQREKERKEEELQKRKALLKRKRELLNKQKQLKQKLDQQRKEQQQRERELNEQEEVQRRLDQKLNEQAKQQQQLERKLKEQEKELQSHVNKGSIEQRQSSIPSEAQSGEEKKKVLSNESNEANTNLLPEFGEDQGNEIRTLQDDVKEEHKTQPEKNETEVKQKKKEMDEAVEQEEKKNNSVNKTVVVRKEEGATTNVTMVLKKKKIENKTLAGPRNGIKNKTEVEKKNITGEAQKQHVVDVANQLPDQVDNVFDQPRSEGEAVKEAFKRYGNGTIREAISEYVQGTFKKSQWQRNILH